MDSKLTLMQNSDLLEFITKEYSIQLISSSFVIENSTVYNQNYLIDGFQSQLQIDNTTLKDCMSYSSIISLSYSTFKSDNLTLSNISSNKQGNSVFKVLFDSVFEISNLKYSNSNSTVLYAYQAQISMANVELSNMQLSDNLVYLAQWTNIVIKNMSASNITSTYLYIIYISDSSANLISNVSMTNISKAGMLISNSNVTEMSMMTMKNVAQGIVVQSNWVIGNLHSSSFVKVGLFNVSNGGALDIIDSSVNLSNSKFEQNKAQSGAAISVRCANYNIWINQFDSSYFVNNTAEIQGGAIYYNYRRPTINNLIFDANSAPYGLNIASYPIKIVEANSLSESITYENVPSGIKIGSILKFALMDYDSQTVPDSSSSIMINSITQGASVLGFNSAKVNSGIAEFNNLIFISSPGAKHIILKVTSNAINLIKNQAQNFNMYTSIDASFRFWMPGEAQISNIRCQTWAPGSYSLLWNSTYCENWLDSVFWAGGAELVVNPEYWRISTNSTTVLDCPSAVCLTWRQLPSRYVPSQMRDWLQGLSLHRVRHCWWSQVC